MRSVRRYAPALPTSEQPGSKSPQLDARQGRTSAAVAASSSNIVACDQCPNARTMEKCMRSGMSLPGMAVAFAGCLAAAGAQTPNTNQNAAPPPQAGASTTAGQDMRLSQD